MRNAAVLVRVAVRPLRAAAVAAAVVLAAASAARADEAVRWNRVATDASVAAQLDPLTESRIFAIMHLAIHDAINAVAPRYESYREHAVDAAGASAAVAAAQAAHDVLAALLPKGADAYAAALSESLAAEPAGEARERGVAVGRAIARELLTEREDDGASREVVYQPGTRPGEYRPTPPDLTPALLAQWGGLRPFGLKSPDQFRPAPPPAPDSAEARAECEEVRLIGGETSPARTPEQTEIARFWYESSPQGWNRIARTLAAARGLDAVDSARLFALVNVAMADGFIAGFEAKYHYRYWRPVTALREMMGEAAWLSHLPTPPVPDHPSTHTVLGAAAATAMADVFGTDFISFEATSGAPYAGISRRFWSLSEAARENGASRVLAGIHFRTAVTAGYEQGEKVARYVCENLLRPLAAMPPPGAQVAGR